MVREQVEVAINAYQNLLAEHNNYNVTEYLKHWLNATEELQPHLRRYMRSVIEFHCRVEGTVTILTVKVKGSGFNKREVASNQHPKYARSVISVLISKYTERLIDGAEAFNEGYCWGRNN